MRILRSIAAALLLALALSASAQVKPGPRQYSLAEILAGKSIPLTITAEEAKRDWQAAEIGLAGSAGLEQMGPSYNFLMSSMRSSAAMGGRSTLILRQFNAVYTKGEIITIDGILNYLTYSYDIADVRVGSDIQMPTLLRLHLVAVAAVVRIQPLGDLFAEPVLAPTDGPTQVTPEQRSTSLSNVKQLAMASLMYCADNDDELPYAQSTGTVLGTHYPYMRSLNIARSPKSGSRIVFNLALAGVNAGDIPEPAKTPMWYEIVPTGTLAAVAFADGHAEQIGDDRHAWLQARLKERFKRRKDMKPLPKDYLLDQIPKSLGGTKPGDDVGGGRQM